MDGSVERAARGEEFDVVVVVRELCRRVLELERQRLDHDPAPEGSRGLDAKASTTKPESSATGRAK